MIPATYSGRSFLSVHMDHRAPRALRRQDPAYTMERGLIGLAAIPHGGIDIVRLVRGAAGALCELSLDAVFDPAAYWQQFMDDLWTDTGLDAGDRHVAQECNGSSFHVSNPSIADREIEAGRLLVRSIQMDFGVPAETLTAPLRHFLAQLVLSAAVTSVDRAAMMLSIEQETHNALSHELATQELCDMLIETKIAEHQWSLGDAICALAGAAAQRLALKRAAMNWRWEDSYQTIADVMMREAVSLGVPASVGWEFGMAANDCRPNPPTALIQAVETSCVVFLDLVGVAAFETQAVVLAKSAGRLLALATSGEEPEIEAHIAKPLACHAMAETLRSFV